MKIQIEITPEQEKGIKEYLKDVAEVENPKKVDIQNEIQQMVDSQLSESNSSIALYIKNL